MIGNSETNADAYDAQCRVPGCPWQIENVTPTILATQLLPHMEMHSAIGAPRFALRITEGFEGTDPDNPHRTADDGWNRDPSPTREQVEQWKTEWNDAAATGGDP